jgi:hypothetical protein
VVGGETGLVGVRRHRVFERVERATGVAVGIRNQPDLRVICYVFNSAQGFFSSVRGYTKFRFVNHPPRVQHATGQR